MTLPAAVRVFFAIEIPEFIREKLTQYQSSLKKAAKTHGIRWTKPNNLHITLQFLSDVRSQDLNRLIECVQKKLHQNVIYPIIHFGELQYFPSSFKPRVIVLNITPPHDLSALSNIVGEGIKDAQYEFENKPYRPHLTLGRIKQPHDIHLQMLSAVDIPDFEEIKPTVVTLFRSEPDVDGSLYTIIERLPLLLPISVSTQSGTLT